MFLNLRLFNIYVWNTVLTVAVRMFVPANLWSICTDFWRDLLWEKADQLIDIRSNWGYFYLYLLRDVTRGSCYIGTITTASDTTFYLKLLKILCRLKFISLNGRCYAPTCIWICADFHIVSILIKIIQSSRNNFTKRTSQKATVLSSHLEECVLLKIVWAHLTKCLISRRFRPRMERTIQTLSGTILSFTLSPQPLII